MANYEELFDTINGIVGGTASAELMHNNANKASERIPTQRDMVAGEVSKFVALNSILPKHIAEAHKKGEIHYHDLDYAPMFGMYNCMLIDVKGMLEQGFRMGNAEIETPKSINTATALVAQIIAQVASHIYGGNTVNRIDEHLAPYVRATYDKWLAIGLRWFKGDKYNAQSFAQERTEKDTYDAFQALEYEINTLHTANGQTPFCTLGFGLGTSWESRLIQKSILQVRRAGLGKTKRTAVFPKLVFAVKRGVNLHPTDPNYDIKQLALKCSSERMYPDFLSYENNVSITGGFKTPMGCRSFLSECVTGETDGRNNMGVVSLNLPRIAIEAQGDMERFWSLLAERTDLAIEALHTRINRLRTVKAKVAPILYVEGACGMRIDPEDCVLKVMGNGRATISLGYIGIEEMVKAMFPESDIKNDVSKQEFAKSVVRYLRERTDAEKKRAGWGFGLYSTPSESLCDRFARLDKAEFGEIKGVTDHGYYTNSFHLDVREKVTPTQKIDFEKDYHWIASGGHISYVEFPNMKHNIKGLERVVDYALSSLGYFGVNTPVDYCGECDYAGEAKATSKGFECPSCGNHNQNTLSVTRRVCGYLGSPNSRPYIAGKQTEVINRVKHTD
ncbi:anaerobic ribonucleoside-triphosphate reductase [Vibrio vulnificus]|uniref:anaerobic ribonucleoside-triphosphate reductase n=1 Tax=Vibrio vulnificus TaxID=672 RepID=UPI0001F5BDF2|nr:anaerobic ribonucleoside-triphosphate reductase [Vibrio vulnificus]ADV88589.1 ribonucleotide reductase of class III (anaerobic), large subunit [Vibrio vulnificus MO6-24/O]